MPREDDQLYVRVDGYKVLLEDLEAVRQLIQNVDEAVQVLNQVRRVKRKTLETLYDNLDQMDQKLQDVEGEMPAVSEMESQVDIEREGSERPGIDQNVEELHSELQSLQEELSNLD